MDYGKLGEVKGEKDRKVLRRRKAQRKGGDGE